jgi:hypothetical protein
MAWYKRKSHLGQFYHYYFKMLIYRVLEWSNKYTIKFVLYQDSWEIIVHGPVWCIPWKRQNVNDYESGSHVL